MPEKFKLRPGETIEKISVSDEDAPDWIKTLVAAGFSNNEIDLIMSHLNQTYKKKMRDPFIEKEFAKIKEDLLKRYGHELTPEESAKIKQGIASRFK